MFFVAIEGIDASGKATQTRLLKEWFCGRKALLSNRALSVHTTSFPAYDSHTGKAILAHLKREWRVQHVLGEEMPSEERRAFDPLVFQCLHTNNRFECLPEIAWSKPDDTVLVSDRYHASALVYGSLDGLPINILDKMNRGLPMPDCYVLLDVSVEESVRRRPERRDRYEEDSAYMSLVRQRYFDLFTERAAMGWHIINGKMSPMDVHKTVVGIVDDCFRTVPAI